MDRFLQMQIFVAVAETEGFAAGARKIGISPPVVTRSISKLEHRLGAKLLNRTTRHVRLTDAGQQFLTDTKRILEDIAAADETVSGIHGQPSGHLSITTSVLFGKLFVMPSVVRYLKLYPQMKVNGLYDDRVVNLIEEGVDVAIRVGQLPDSSLRAIHVGNVRRVICASPDYLAEHGSPKKPEDLLKHTIVSASGNNGSADWRFKNDQSIRIQPRLSLSTNDAAIDAAVSGFGITRLMSYQIAPELNNKELCILLEDYEQPSCPINILHHEGRNASIKIRSFIDLLVEDLRSNKALKESL